MIKVDEQSSDGRKKVWLPGWGAMFVLAFFYYSIILLFVCRYKDSAPNKKLWCQCLGANG